MKVRTRDITSHRSSPLPLLALVQLPEREDPVWASVGRVSLLLGRSGHGTVSPES